MCKVIVFAGTTEGREIAEFLDRRQIPGHICVATEYGEQLLPESPVLEISHQRLDLEEMKVLFQEKDPEMVVDATHPYAAQVTENIKKACEETGKEYIRILRENQEMDERRGRLDLCGQRGKGRGTSFPYRRKYSGYHRKQGSG